MNFRSKFFGASIIALSALVSFSVYSEFALYKNSIEAPPDPTFLEFAKTSTDSLSLISISLILSIIGWNFLRQQHTLSKFFGLRTEVSSYSKNPTDNEDFLRLKMQVDRVQQELKVAKPKLDLSLEDKEALIEASKVEILKDILPETENLLFQKALQSQFGKTADASLRRLGQQIEVLGSRANLNLIMGVLFCSFGLIALWMTFFVRDGVTTSIAPTTGNTDFLDFAKEYIPRLSLVLIIEVIGFFFLRLYTRTLSDIRYVQNELTNVEMKMIALTVSLKRGEAKIINNVIESFTSTERNAVISKDQTSLEIEKERASSEAQERLMQTLPSIIHGTNGKSG